MTEGLLYIINAACFSMGIDSSGFFTSCYYSDFLRDCCNPSECGREQVYMAIYHLRKYYQCVRNSKILIDSSDTYMSNARMLPSHPSENDAHNYARAFTDIVFSETDNASLSEPDTCSLYFLQPCKYELCVHSYIDRLSECTKNHRRRMSLFFSDNEQVLYSFFYKKELLTTIKNDCKDTESGDFSDSIKAFYAICKKRIRSKNFDDSDFTEMIKIRSF